MTLLPEHAQACTYTPRRHTHTKCSANQSTAIIESNPPPHTTSCTLLTPTKGGRKPPNILLPDSIEECCRKQYFDFIYIVVTGRSDRYDPDQSGLTQYFKLETILITGKVDIDAASRYPELDSLTLPVQLEMFKHTYKAETLREAKLEYQSMAHVVRLLFPTGSGCSTESSQ